jgi:hypothetical protein
MMLRNLSILLLPCVLLFPATGHGDPSEPSNYDECILDAMRGVSSDVAARAIMESCRNLYPEAENGAVPAPEPVPLDADVEAAAEEVPMPPPPAAPVPEPAPLDSTDARSLTEAELASLSAKAKIFGSTYRVTVHNGNPNLTLTEVTIAVWDDSDLGATRKEYSEAVEIAPQNAEMVKYTVHYRGNETGWRWAVVAARGVD